ncbi:glycosyltransferase [Alicyclobacillaceae bacterium I2511]|nr:glycosyltransferase [Alicyclobacillaceae bacterium I2511]
MGVSKVLILTASFGDGHNQAAIAVAEALKQQGATVAVADFVEWLNPALRSFAKFSLIQGVQKAPALYGKFYNSISKAPPISSLQRRIHHLGWTRMYRTLRTFNPDVVASTFPTPAGVLSELRAIGATAVPSVGILTDYTMHGQWIQAHADTYFVATTEVQQELLTHGVLPQQVEVTGIPVRQRFVEAIEGDLVAKRRQLREQYHWRQDLPLIVVMGGGAGLFGDMGEWERVLRKHQQQAQFAIICGHNERWQRRFQHLRSETVQILGYVTEVEQWMTMADLLITKAGGITVSEAMTMELPMLLYRPIPGQEDHNSAFALQAGFARLANNVKTAQVVIGQLTDSPELLEQMRANARAHRTPQAAAQIAHAILAMSERPHPRTGLRPGVNRAVKVRRVNRTPLRDMMNPR